MAAEYDVVVVGAGNAAFCAALAAAEAGRRVLVLERAPEEESGGNSRYTAGLMRCAYRGVEDLKRVIPDLSDEEVARTDFGTYTEEQFLDDMGRVTEYRCDPDLTEILVKNSLPTLEWMRSKGVRFTAAWGRQAFNIGGRFKFWGGLTVEAVGGGPGLVESLTSIAKKNGIEVWFEARALALVVDDDGVKGVRIKQKGKTKEIKAKSVVLAAGGFQSDPEQRVRYLGPGWELAKVRGTRFNTGDGIRMALDAGAAATGGSALSAGLLQAVRARRAKQAPAAMRIWRLPNSEGRRYRGLKRGARRYDPRHEPDYRQHRRAPLRAH